jgi:hypothetical protein
MEEVTASIKILEVSDRAERRLRILVQKHITQSLYYPAMTDRYENVSEAHPETFNWAFQDPIEQ